MNQPLSEPLNKYLIKLVNKEANEEWSKQESPTLPPYEKTKVKPLSAGVYNLVRQILP